MEEVPRGPGPRLIHIALDRSLSMKELDVSGKTKEEAALESLRKGLCKILTERWDIFSHKADRVYMSISFFGERGFNKGKSYLILEPTSLRELRDRIEEGKGCEHLFRVAQIEGNGTDSGQIAKGFEAALERLRQKLRVDELPQHTRVTIVLITDGCFNLYEGKRVDGLDAARMLDARMNSIIAEMIKAERAKRAVIGIMFGIPDRIEVDDGICPKRLAHVVSRNDDRVVLPAILQELEKLVNEGTLIQDSIWADLPARGPNDKIADYLVYRLKENDLSKLAEIVVRVTEPTARAG